MLKVYKLYFTFAKGTTDPKNGNDMGMNFVEVISTNEFFPGADVDLRYLVFKDEAQKAIMERFGRHWGMLWTEHEFNVDTCYGGIYDRIYLPVADIEIESHDPFLDMESMVKEMEEKEFVNPKEYEQLKKRCARLGFTEYICREYHLFYQTSPVMLDITDPGRYFLLAERGLGFFEELPINVNYCTPNINLGPDIEEYVFDEGDKTNIALQLDLANNKIHVW